MAAETEKPAEASDIEKQDQTQTGSSADVSHHTADRRADLQKLDSKTVQPKSEDDIDAALAHLPETEQAILKEQLFIPEVKVTYITLFRYASAKDIFIFVVSSICSIGAGAALPLFTVSRQLEDLFL
jgi:ATP-binding cassette subfamily B (MDR/TAP) protein 1